MKNKNEEERDMKIMNYNIEDVPALRENASALVEAAKNKKKVLEGLREDFAKAGQDKIVKSLDGLIMSAEEEIKNNENYEQVIDELCKKIEAMTEAMQG